VILRHLVHVQKAQLAREVLLTTNPVDGSVSSGRDKPRLRISRLAIARPRFRGSGERLLRGLLGEVEVAEEADEGGENTPPEVAEGSGVEDR
jgi:hypothetical protein